MKTYNILTFDEKLILSNQTQQQVDAFFIGKEESLYKLEVASEIYETVAEFLGLKNTTVVKYFQTGIKKHI